MKRSVLLILSVSLLVLPATALAADCYILANRSEWRAQPYTLGVSEERISGSSFSEGSHLRELGGGCSINRYVNIEGVHFPSYRSHLTLTSFAPTWQFSLLGRVPIDERSEWSLTGRFDIFRGEPRSQFQTAEFWQEYQLPLGEKGNFSVRGMGVLYRPYGEDWSLGVERRRLEGARDRVTMLTWRMRF